MQAWRAAGPAESAFLRNTSAARVVPRIGAIAVRSLSQVKCGIARDTAGL
jgi:hypothetical protein